MRISSLFAHRYAPRLALAGGALAGGGYTLQSAAHMVVPGPYDKLIVGALLATLGAGIGWLAAAMGAMPLRIAERDSAGGEECQATLRVEEC